MAPKVGARRHSLGTAAGTITDIARIEDAGVIVTPIPGQQGPDRLLGSHLGEGGAGGLRGIAPVAAGGRGGSTPPIDDGEATRGGRGAYFPCVERVTYPDFTRRWRYLGEPGPNGAQSESRQIQHGIQSDGVNGTAT